MPDLTDVRQRLQASRLTVATTTYQHLRRYGRFALYVNVLATLAVGASTFMQFYVSEKWLTSHIVGMSISTAAFVLTAFQLFLNADASKEIEAANEAIADAESIERELRQEANLRSRLEEDQEGVLREHRTRLYEANQALDALLWINEAIEQSLTKDSTGTGFMKDILEAGAPSLKRTFRFNNDQAYALNVYEADKSGANIVLRLVGHVRSTACDMATASRWSPGEGVAGHCFSRNELVDIPDSADRSAATIVAPAKLPGHKTPGSFLAAPIRTGNPEVVWGVVVASCSDPYHFVEEQDGYDELGTGKVKPGSPAGRIRVLAGVLALAVQAHLAKNASPEG